MVDSLKLKIKMNIKIYFSHLFCDLQIFYFDQFSRFEDYISNYQMYQNYLRNLHEILEEASTQYKGTFSNPTIFLHCITSRGR